jgi:hypothetical protein
MRIILAACIAWAAVNVPAMAQELPNLREARNLAFAERGAIEWEIYPHSSLSELDLATLEQINQLQPQMYYAAMAISPRDGLASETTALAANYHDEDNARAAALETCNSARSGGPRCVIVMVVRPQGWEPGRALQLSTQATAALRGDYRRLPRQTRAMAISVSTGQWGIGQGREAAIAACAVSDCQVVVEY